MRLHAFVPILLLSLCCGQAGAIVIRHDVPDARYRADAGDFPALFTIYWTKAGHGDCIATLVAPRWAVTAAHCTRDEPLVGAVARGGGHPVRIGGAEARIVAVVPHPAVAGGNAPDLALVRLVEPVDGVAQLPLYRRADERGEVVTMPGWGGTGNGRDGLGEEDGGFRVADNRVDRADGLLLRWTFDAPDSGRALPREGISGPGDSGGPALLRTGEGWAIAGVGSSQRTMGGPEGLYGVEEVFVRVSAAADWIDATIAAYEPTAAAGDADLVAALERFELRSNLHVNLHHFLHALARGPADPQAWLRAQAPGLDDDGHAALLAAVAYYREDLAKRDLLFDGYLSNVKYHLMEHASAEPLAAGRMREQHHAALVSARPAYERHFWPAHDAANRRLVEGSLELIRVIEQPTLARIEALSGEHYPQQLFVHLSWFANRLGAYTTIHPHTVAVIESRHVGAPGAADNFVELLFHEPTHALILPDRGTVAHAIERVAGRLGVQPPRDLWHAILFHFVGSAVQEQLARHGQPDYEIYMKRNDVFSALHGPVLGAMPAYVDGRTSLDDALEEALRRAAADSAR